MDVVIIGGHGRVALLAAPLLLDRGHSVRSWVRDPAHLDEVGSTGATPLLADVEQLGTDAMAALLDGADAVVWSAGAGGGDAARTAAVDRDAAIRSVDAAELAGVRRYVMVSYFGARRDHGVAPDSSFHAYAEAKAAADEHLRRSRLEWTILGPSSLTSEQGTGRIEVADDPASGHPAPGDVPRADVAAVLATVLDEPAAARRTIAFNRGDTPIADAIGVP